MNDDIYSEPRRKYYSFEDNNFVIGDSPVTHDIFTALGKNGVDGYIFVDGSGDIGVQISPDGSVYGQSITLKQYDNFSLKSIVANKIKITHVSNSAYRVFVI